MFSKKCELCGGDLELADNFKTITYVCNECGHAFSLTYIAMRGDDYTPPDEEQIELFRGYKSKW
jgi:thymidine kinase